MIPKLRRKFISITAAALFSMILLVIAAINCVFAFQSSKMLNARLDQIMEGPDRGTPDPDGDRHWQKETLPPLTASPGRDDTTAADGISNGKKPANAADVSQKANRLPRTHTPDFQDNGPRHIPDAYTDSFHPFNMKLLIRPDGCLLYLDTEGTLLEVIQDAAMHYSEEELSDIAADISGLGKENGWYQYFKFRMETETAPDGSARVKLGLINASSDLYSVFTMLLISLFIGVLSFLLVLLAIIFASGRAVKPIAESYARQKQFVTDAGHELKTPLTVISANNELARMIYGKSEWFDSIDTQVAKMNGLVRSLITLARMDEEQAPVFAPFNLSDAVYDTAKSFENLIHTSGRVITFDIADDIICSGDESRLRQVISILMDNAAKYCDANGKISVSLTKEKQIRLRVTNDYAAAADCDLSRVFERFYRADKARTPDGSYGLGLSIAKSIVELHGGEIRAKALDHDRLLFEVILGGAPRMRREGTPSGSR